MARTWLVPLLALLVAVAGIARYEAPARGGSRGRVAAAAGAEDHAWHCSTVPAARGHTVVRRAALANFEQFSASDVAACDRLPPLVAASRLAGGRASFRLLTLHQLQVKLQV
jgi:hypothetical protein